MIARCLTRNNVLVAEYLVNTDGSVEELYLRPAFRKRFDQAFTRGIEWPSPSAYSEFNVPKGSKQSVILKSLFMTLEKNYGDIYEWPSDC